MCKRSATSPNLKFCFIIKKSPSKDFIRRDFGKHIEQPHGTLVETVSDERATRCWLFKFVSSL